MRADGARAAGGRAPQGPLGGAPTTPLQSSDEPCEDADGGQPAGQAGVSVHPPRIRSRRGSVDPASGGSGRTRVGLGSAASCLRALLLALALAAPAAAQDAPQAPAPQEEGPTGPIAVEEEAGQDEAIERRVAGILRELGGYEGVAVSVSEGVVSLEGEATDGAAVTRLDDLVGRVEGVVAIENEVRASADVGRRLDPAVKRFRARAEQAIAFLPLLAIALAAFAAILVAGLLIARGRWPWERLAPNAFVAEIYRQIARLAFAILAVVVALDILGATALLGTILGAAGLVGLAIGFAVRDTVENFIASVMLSFRQPFRPNDLVEIEGDVGKVIRLTSRATILLDLDGNQIRIPNATVFKARILNYSRNRERRFLFEIGVAPDADLARVRELACRTVAGLPFVMTEPAAVAWIDRIGDGAVFLHVTGWIDQTATEFLPARGEALRVVKAAIEAMGVEVPDTTYRVQLLGQGAAQVTETDGDEPPSPPPSPAAVETPPPEADRALERIIAAERGDGGHPDLLDHRAPVE